MYLHFIDIKLFCFNSRAREGRDLAIRGDRLYDKVSTHAPARGATRSLSRFCSHQYSFQLTRPRGARLYMGTLFKSAGRFNSRAREGRDLSETSAVNLK